jgi:uncharacterized protein
MASNPVTWFEIYVDDLARARQFYESVLGVTLDILSDPNDTNIEMFSFPSSMVLAVPWSKWRAFHLVEIVL